MQDQLIAEIRARRCADVVSNIGIRTKSKLASKLRAMDSYGWAYRPSTWEHAKLTGQRQPEPQAVQLPAPRAPRRAAQQHPEHDQRQTEPAAEPKPPAEPEAAQLSEIPQQQPLQAEAEPAAEPRPAQQLAAPAAAAAEPEQDDELSVMSVVRPCTLCCLQGAGLWYESCAA